MTISMNKKTTFELAKKAWNSRHRPPALTACAFVAAGVAAELLNIRADLYLPVLTVTGALATTSSIIDANYKHGYISEKEYKEQDAIWFKCGIPLAFLTCAYLYSLKDYKPDPDLPYLKQATSEVCYIKGDSVKIDSTVKNKKGYTLPHHSISIVDTQENKTKGTENATFKLTFDKQDPIFNQISTASITYKTDDRPLKREQGTCIPLPLLTKTLK